MNTESTTIGTSGRKTAWSRQLYFWVIVAIVAGVLVGWLWPDAGVAMEPIGTTFVAAMRMLIGPIVFLTIVGGIASVADLKKVGMTGIKALTYFQVGTLFAMLFGLLAINLFPVGEGVNADVSKIEASDSVNALIQRGETQHWWQLIDAVRTGAAEIGLLGAPDSVQRAGRGWRTRPVRRFCRSTRSPTCGSPSSADAHSSRPRHAPSSTPPRHTRTTRRRPRSCRHLPQPDPVSRRRPARAADRRTARLCGQHDPDEALNVGPRAAR
jgi:hypothetical protein